MDYTCLVHFPWPCKASDSTCFDPEIPAAETDPTQHTNFGHIPAAGLPVGSMAVSMPDTSAAPRNKKTGRVVDLRPFQLFQSRLLK